MDDPELQKTKDDTAQIFFEYAKLLSQKSSAEKDPKCSEEIRSATEADSSPTAAEETTVPPLTRSKSRDAGKDLHPRLVLSVKPPVVVDGHHCRAGADAKLKSPPPPPPESSAEASNPISLTAPVSSTDSAVKTGRPDSLLPPHRRNPSFHSTDSSAQAQDPPMEPILSPVANDFTTSLPLALQGANSPATERREGLVQSAEHARTVAEPSSKSPCRVAQERHRELAAATIVDSDPRNVKARKIADRLKEIGDMVEDEHVKSRIHDIMSAVSEWSDTVSLGDSTAQMLYSLLSWRELSWRRVVEIFKLLCYVSRYDDQFTIFEKVWHCLLDKIVPWIQDNGGWSAFLRANSSGCHANTPSVVRRHPIPAQSEPDLPGYATPTCLRHARPPSCVQRDVADSRNLIGRMALTPQMSRPSRREQSSPCLSQSYTQAPPTMSEASSRHRLWSLTERGSFQNEDGQEDIERSISEFEMTEGEDEDDTFLNSQEEREEEETQDGEQTLTSSTLRSALACPSTPITVPSPHSCSQPDPSSTDDLHSDSGIENLSLSCSPPRVGFSVGGGVSHRHSPMLLARNQTSLTSLSSAASAASASPIHTSPSSRKNSSSNGNFGKARPRSSGSFKESSHRQGNEATSGFYRTGSLTRQHTRMATPTNTTPTRFGGSHHASWREDPNVRRVSTTAYEVYQLLKAVFNSP